ncbi:hypothetical protein B0T17DRAFT_508629 [Bombardia bombarda]|uniref:Uncharacterized protein n=1 Tax=Bombardia bombarda TaxID=252184 RepID=A0AA40C186_9PEZI|nr:hypothetical protein B0T17DRAFT_508629 [Bombardia bombarda]
MMETATLQPPKSGRSRFSKALPAPPPSFPDFSGQSPSLSQLHTQFQYQAQSPPPTAPSLSSPKQLPLPPPKELLIGRQVETAMGTATATATTATEPWDLPLPPVPTKTERLPPPMTMPKRRPVAAVSTPSSASTLAPELGPVPGLGSPILELSPAASFSSLFSAYSNHSSDTTPRSSANSANDIRGTKDSSLIVGREPRPSPTLPSGPYVRERGGSEKPATDFEALPPPPPMKDPQLGPQRPQTPPKPVQSPTADQPTSSLTNSPPQQGQLWRRRSLKNDKNKSLTVPELKLIISHGSTVASTAASPPASSQNLTQNATTHSQSHNQQYQPKDQIESSAPRAIARVPLPRSTNATLPGRNIRPVAARKPVSPREEENMGQQPSSLSDKVMKGRSPVNEMPGANGYGASQGVSIPADSITPSPSAARLPTPKDETNNVRSYAETTVTPASPASPVSSPKQSSVSSFLSSFKSAKNSNAGTTPLMPEATSLAPPTRPPKGGLPSSPAVNRGRAPSLAQQPPRASPVTQDGQRAPPTAPDRRDQSAGPVRLPMPKQREQETRRNYTEEYKTVSETGSVESDQTVRNTPQDAVGSINAIALSPPPVIAESEKESTDNPGAALFPRNWYTALPADMIMDAPPLAERHFKCLTNHRYMTVNRQKYNPIACRMCGHKDRNAECFICSACHLNICGGCSGNLRRYKGNLEQTMKYLKERKPMAGTDDRTATMTQPEFSRDGERGRGFCRLVLSSDGWMGRDGCNVKIACLIEKKTGKRTTAEKNMVRLGLGLACLRGV